MKILFDQGVPVPLRRALPAHSVSTAYEIGWAELSNRALLKKADAEFDILITTDQGLRFQQNLGGPSSRNHCSAVHGLGGDPPTPRRNCCGNEQCPYRRGRGPELALTPSISTRAGSRDSARSR